MFRFALALFLTLAAFWSYAAHAEDEGAMKKLAVLLQTELARVGCSPGDIDGYWGNNSFLAMKAFNEATGEKFLVYKPSQDALERVKEHTGKVCSSVCGAGQCVTGQVVKKVKTKPKVNPYDGSYQINGERIKNEKKLFCSDSFEIKFMVRDGKTNHKIPLGHMLSGEVKESTLHLSSPAEKNGGHWIGLFALGSKKDAVTIGTFKWVGAKDGASCAYQAIIRRL